MTPLRADLDAIEARINAATKGPWSADAGSRRVTADGHREIAETAWDTYPSYAPTLVEAWDNAALIAHAPADLRRLVQGLRLAARALERYAEHEAWTDVETTFAYAPHEWAFDWPGDLGDKPWSIAAEALAALDALGKEWK